MTKNNQKTKDSDVQDQDFERLVSRPRLESREPTGALAFVLVCCYYMFLFLIMCARLS